MCSSDLAWRRRTVGFTGSDERMLTSWVLVARLAGGAEIRRDPDGTMTMKVMHSKESIPAAVTVQEEALVARVRHSAAREEEWRKKEAETKQRASAAPPKPTKNARRHARDRALAKEQKRELAELRAQKQQQQQQQQPQGDEQPMEEDIGSASQQQPPPQQQPVAAAATPSAGAGSVAEAGVRLLEQAIAQLTQLAPLQSGPGVAETRDRQIELDLPGGSARLHVVVKANTKGAAWSDKEFGKRLQETLRGAGAAPAQWQQLLMKFVNEELDTPWNRESQDPTGAGQLAWLGRA